MRMTRWISLALVAIMALAGGIAVAHNGGGKAQPTEEVTATFTTAPVADKSRTKTCTGVDGTYSISKSVDQGESNGDARLTGKITIRSKTVVNNDTGLGWSEGNVFIQDATSNKQKAVAHFDATVKNGALEGLAEGKVKNPAPATKAKGDNGHGRGGKFNSTLLANFSATIGQDGSVNGKVGGGGGDNVAILHGNPCAPPERPAAPNENHGDHHENHGDNGHHGGDDGKK
jgi:hypothetical protein